MNESVSVSLFIMCLCTVSVCIVKSLKKLSDLIKDSSMKPVTYLRSIGKRSIFTGPLSEQAVIIRTTYGRRDSRGCEESPENRGNSSVVSLHSDL